MSNLNKTSNKPEPGSNDFRLTMQIAKTRTETNQVLRKNTDGDEESVTVETRYVSGLASGVGVDLENERMAESAIQAFKSAIDTGVMRTDGTWGMIPLRSGHRNEWDDILGYIVSAEVDKDHNLWIEAELEDTNAADDLYKTLTKKSKPGRESKLGLSVAGRILSASEEIDMATLQRRRVFNEVALREISVVGQPAYPTAFLEAMTKSVDWDNPPINLSREMPTMANEKIEKNEGTNAEVPENTEVAREAITPPSGDKSVEAADAPKEVQAAPAEKSIEPDFDADIKREATAKSGKTEAIDPEIKRISEEKKKAKAESQKPVGETVAKDAASDALDEVDDAMDDALINAMKSSYDQLLGLVGKAKMLLDADDNSENEATESEDDMAELIDDAQDDALIATIREVNEQVYSIVSTLRQLFRADDAVDSMVENGGYSYYWSKKEEAPDVVKTTPKKKEHIMDEAQVSSLVKSAVEAAVNSALTGQSDVIAKMAAKIEELETTPVSKALVVASAKEGAANVDPREAFRKSWEGKVVSGNGSDILKSAVAAAMQAGQAQE